MRRSGFSLLEILLAAAILVGSLAVLSELASLGRHHAWGMEDLSTAQRICQSKMNEILAGVSSAMTVEDLEVENEPGWFYSVQSEPAPQQGLRAVRVTVTKDVPEPRRPVQFTLVRWIRDDQSSLDADSLDSLFSPLDSSMDSDSPLDSPSPRESSPPPSPEDLGLEL